MQCPCLMLCKCIYCHFVAINRVSRFSTNAIAVYENADLINIDSLYRKGIGVRPVLT